MGESIIVPFWPTTPDCLKWSSDNQIAVAGGERITILTNGLKKPAQNASRWDLETFTATSFTAKEIPRALPFSANSLSLGEELSTWHVQAIAWSYPGLGPRRRCVLAVLTSNHILSIWALESSPSVQNTWKRKLIVNDMIREYFQGSEQSPSGTNGDSSSNPEPMQVGQRIRAFAWGPPLYERGREQSTQCLGWGHHFLAVSTERGDVLILRVQSPYEEHSLPESGWTVCVTGMLHSYALVATNDSERPVGASPVLKRSTTGSKAPLTALHLTWDDWKWQDSTGDVATLVLVVNGRLIAAPLCAQWSSHSPLVTPLDQSEHSFPLGERADICGPLIFDRRAGSSILTAFAENAVFHLPEHGVQSHHLDDRWSDVSGVAVIQQTNVDRSLLVLTQLSSLAAPSATLALPLGDGAHQYRSVRSWRDAVIKSKMAFNDEHNLKGKVQERFWGACSSPLHEYVATCTTMHSSDGPAYVILSERTGVVNITYEGQIADDLFLPFHDSPGTPSAQVLVSSVQQYLQRQSRASGAPEPSKSMLVDQVWLTMRSFSVVPDGPVSRRASDTRRNSHLIHRLRLRLYSDAEMQKARASRLVEIALGDEQAIRQISPLIVQTLIQEVLAITSELPQLEGISLRVQRTYQTVLSKLNPNYISNGHETSTMDLNEQCTVCQGEIRFESLRWARCVAGHHFPRCALSFLPIREPGSTKTCAVCDLQFLDELTSGDFAWSARVTRDDETDTIQARGRDRSGNNAPGRRSQSSETPLLLSLARVLFIACDVCMYCGGKYKI